MRGAFRGLLAGCALLTSGALPAVAAEYPFCIRGCDFGGGRGDCSFSSYQQCQATASGRDAFCAENPYYNANANAELPINRSRLSRKKF
jgi:Protein of unknown function (DUF3551)